MARTDATQIAAIIELDTTIGLTPFILIANELVTELCTDSDYSDERLEAIETWLAAHFYCTRDPRATSESVGVSQSNQLYTGANLQNTQYGQAAMALDTKGNLNILNKQMTDGKGKPKVVVETLMLDTDRTYYGVT